MDRAGAERANDAYCSRGSGAAISAHCDTALIGCSTRGFVRIGFARVGGAVGSALVQQGLIGSAVVGQGYAGSARIGQGLIDSALAG